MILELCLQPTVIYREADTAFYGSVLDTVLQPTVILVRLKLRLLLDSSTNPFSLLTNSVSLKLNKQAAPS